MILQDIFKKFEELSEEKKRFLSSPIVLASIEELEKKYNIKIALILMEMTISENQSNFLNFLIDKLHLSKEKAQQLLADLKEKILDEFYSIDKAEKKDIKDNNKSVKDNLNSFIKSEKNNQKPIKLQDKVILPKENKNKPKKKILPPPPPAILSQKNKDFEDNTKQEIEKIKINNQLKNLSVKKINWDKEADNIINNLDIAVSEENLERKLKNILANTLRGVRSIHNLRDILGQRKEKGGIGLSDVLIDNIIKNIKKIKETINPTIKSLERTFVLGKEGEPMIKKDKNNINNQQILTNLTHQKEIIEHNIMSLPINLSKQNNNQLQKINKNRKSLIKIKKDSTFPFFRKKIKNLIKEEEVKKEKIIAEKRNEMKKYFDKAINNILVKEQNVFNKEKNNQSGKSYNNIQTNKKSSLLKVPFLNSSQNINLSSLNNNLSPKKQDKNYQKEKNKKDKNGFFSRLFGEKEKLVVQPRKKRKIEDIKRVDKVATQGVFGHKLIGPIEELEGLSLNDFRHFSQDPVVAIKKIEDKINNLEIESLSKKIMGIKAWKECEINKAYLSLLNEALIKNTSFENIINSRKQARVPTINIEEFYAIADFNKRLRF